MEDYLPLLIPGILAQTVLTACIATGIQLREDMDKGVFDRFKVLPIARIAPLAGPMVADMLRYLIAASLTFATGIVIGYRPGGGVPGVLMAILLASSRAGRWPGSSPGSARSARAPRPCRATRMMVMFPLTFLSNAFVPADTLPRWLEASPRSTRSRTSSPRCATSRTPARHGRGRLGAASAAWP